MKAASALVAATVIALALHGCSAAADVESSVAELGRATFAASLPGGDTLRWHLAGPPKGRYGTQMAWMDRQDRMVLFGGSDIETALDDTWEWDGVRWLERDLDARPPARYHHALAYDASRGRLVVFGGRGPEGAALSDTWEFDGTSWTEIAVAARPPGRTETRMAYDAGRRRVVLFGGYDGNAGSLDDTWEYDGRTWSNPIPATKPSGRRAHGLTYDATRQRVVLFGGRRDTTALADTWTFDGTTWVRQSTGSSPVARYGQSLAYDPQRAKVVLFGGQRDFFTDVNDTWLLDATGWTALPALGAPGPRRNAAFAYDPNRRRVVLYGGDRFSTVLVPPLDGTFEWDGTDWTARGPLAIPPARTGPNLVSDVDRNVLVLFGGLQPTISLDDTHEWDGLTWRLRTLATRPPARYAHGMAYDRARRKTIVYGGLRRNADGSSSIYSDMWSFDGAGAGSWTRLFPSISPGFRAYHGFAYDEARQVIVLSSGVNTSGSSVGDTWEWNGATWSQVTPAIVSDAPTFFPRQQHGMTYDASRQRVVAFAGLLNFGIETNQTWDYDGLQWIDVKGGELPISRRLAPIAYDALRRRIVMYGGYNAGLTYSDTWERSGTTWLQRGPRRAPPGLWGAGLAYDDARHSVTLFGGADATSMYLDTWILLSRGGVCATDAECGSGFCTDGVCCDAKSCSACATCNGSDPGRCTPVRNEPDPDSCAGASTCDRAGACKSSVGAAAVSATECASGFLVDGVCCDSACTGTCQACAADLKASGSRSGVCDNAKAGIDLRDHCRAEPAATCGLSGMCDGRGDCAKHAPGTACGDVLCGEGDRASGLICDGLGACARNADGVVCRPYVCAAGAGCKSSCVADPDCIATHRCAAGTCVSRSDASCDGDHTLIAPDGTTTDCGAYKCEGSACKTSCGRVDDCVSPSSCSTQGLCVAFENTPSGDSAGCSLGLRSEGSRPCPSGVALAYAILALVCGRSERFRRRPS